MKIKKVTVENVLGAPAAELTMSGSPLALVVGDNAIGKSSIREAISLALLGLSDRAGAKKDWDKLVTSGATSGRVLIEFASGETAKLSLPSGKGASPFAGEDDMSKTLLSFMLGAARFSELKDKDRRSLIAKLYGSAESHEVIANKLIEAGHAEPRVTKIKSLLRSGIDAAKAQALAYGTEGKGAWKLITGEQWGIAKGAEWVPSEDQGPKPQRAIIEAQQEVSKLNGEIAALQRSIGSASAVLSAQEIQDLRDRAAKRVDREKRFKDLDDSLARFDARLRELNAQVQFAQQDSALACPCCSARLSLANDALVEFTPVSAKDRQELNRELQALKSDRDAEHEALQKASSDLTESNQATDWLRKIDEAPAVNAEALEQDLAAKQARLEAVNAEIVATRHYISWQTRRDDAATEHADIVAWLALAEKLDDPKLASDGTTDPVSAFNDDLQAVDEALDWPAIQLNSEGEFFAGGFLIRFVSESDRWKADAAAAIAFARRTQVGMVLLDRADVLAPQARPDLFRFLAFDSGLESAIVFATLKEPPTVPEDVAVLWLGTRARAVGA